MLSYPWFESCIKCRTCFARSQCILCPLAFPSYQVEEMLLYTAELKRSISEPLSSKKAAVDQV